ncbi:hypothetical protein ACFLWH_01340 [Chloroflexota bacterium]
MAEIYHAYSSEKWGNILKIQTILACISIVIGLPGFIAACAFPLYRAYGVFALFISAVLIVLWYLLNLPFWTIIEMTRVIELKDPEGSLTKVTKTANIRANHKGLTEYLHRKMRSDGTINNFRLDSNPVPIKDIEKRAGEYMVYERFEPMKRWQTRNSCLSYDIHKGFHKDREFSGYIPDYPTNKFKLEVHLPSQRTARNPKAYKGTGAETQELDTPELSSDGQKITWNGKKLKPGSNYRLQWDW